MNNPFDVRCPACGSPNVYCCDSRGEQWRHSSCSNPASGSETIFLVEPNVAQWAASHYGRLSREAAADEASRRRSPLYREPGHEIEPDLQSGDLVDLILHLRTIEDLLYSGILELAVQDANPKLENIRAIAAQIIELIDRKGK